MELSMASSLYRGRAGILGLSYSSPRSGAPLIKVPVAELRRDERFWGDADRARSVAAIWLACGLLSVVLLIAAAAWVGYWTTRSDTAPASATAARTTAVRYVEPARADTSVLAGGDLAALYAAGGSVARSR